MKEDDNKLIERIARLTICCYWLPPQSAEEHLFVLQRDGTVILEITIAHHG